MDNRPHVPYPEFLENLKKTPRNWYVNADGGIRTRKPTQDLVSCPGMECDIFNRNNSYYSWNVAAAADNEEGHDPAIRQDLLDACGLSGK